MRPEYAHGFTLIMKIMYIKCGRRGKKNIQILHAAPKAVTK